MKLDKTPISTPEKVSSISAENAIIELDNLEKINPDKLAPCLRFSEEEHQNVEEDIVVQLNSLNLNHIKENSNNITESVNVTKIKNEATVMDLIDETLKRVGRRIQYKDIFTFDLSGEGIKVVEESISSKLARLVVLNLSHNSLSKLPDLLDFKCLKELDISHNNFEDVPVCIQIFFSKLVILDMSYNQIKIFDQPMCTHTLRKLAINHNLGMRIPEWFWYIEFYSLEELDMSFTDPFLENLPIWLMNYMELKTRGVFTNLISLKIQNTAAHMNNISQLQYLKHIKYLNISNDLDARNSSIVNVMWEIPSCILQLTTVQELHLSSVQLSSLPEEIGNLACLEILNLSHNKVYKLPKSVTKLTSLKELNVSHNHLLELPVKIGSLYNLTILHAQNNDLRQLPVGFKDLNLVYCDLYNNELEEVCIPIIREMKTLHSLDIMHNCINLALVPLDLQKNLRDALAKPSERLSEAKVLIEYIEEPESESDHTPDGHHRSHNYSGYGSFSSSRSQSPEPEYDQLQPVMKPESPNDSNWDDEATHSDEFNFCLGDDWHNRLPKNYDEAIENFRTRERGDTCFIPGDTQIKFFKRKEPRRWNLLSRPVVPGQFDDAE